MLETRDRGPQKPCVSCFEVVGGVVVMSVPCFSKRVVVGNKKDPSVTQNASGRGARRRLSFRAREWWWWAGSPLRHSKQGWW